MYKALLAICLTLGLLVACNSTAPLPPEPEPENLGTSTQALLSQGEPCNADVQCAAPAGFPARTYGFCVDTVCCNQACGGGVRDNQVCSNVYNPTLTGQTIATPGTCVTLKIGDPCGDLDGLNPCTW